MYLESLDPDKKSRKGPRKLFLCYPRGWHLEEEIRRARAVAGVSGNTIGFLKFGF